MDDRQAANNALDRVTRHELEEAAETALASERSAATVARAAECSAAEAAQAEERSAEAASSPRCAGVGNIDAGQGVALSRCADGNRSLGRLVLADATDARLAMGSCPRDHHKHTCRALARPAPEWHLSG